MSVRAPNKETSLLTDNAITMLSCRFETFPEQVFKLVERFTVYTTEHFDILQRELERSSLEAHIAWGIAEQETKVDVN